MKMRIKISTKIVSFVVAALILTSCAGNAASNNEEGPGGTETDRSFFYQNTHWGMSVDEVIEARGVPDVRTDEIEEEEEFGIPIEIEGADDFDGEADDTEYLDFIYFDRTIFDSHDVDETFLFDGNNELWGVISRLDTGEVLQDRSNRDEIAANADRMYMELRDILVEKYGEPDAEFTAFRDGDEYVTDEFLDLERENAVVCASRWDGDNYRFIYILYYKNAIQLDVRYIPHDPETVEANNAAAQNQ